MKLIERIKKFFDNFKTRCSKCKEPVWHHYANLCERCQQEELRKYEIEELKEKRSEEVRLAKLNAKYIAEALKKKR